MDLVPDQIKNMSKEKKELLKKSGDMYAIELMRNESKNPYFYIGRNPTVDIVALKDNNSKILLVKRCKNVLTYPGAWSLPGGFQESSSKRGETFETSETLIDAAIRELKEETGLDLFQYKNLFKKIGIFEGQNRDPRNNKESWSASTAFLISLPENLSSKVKAGDDAADAEWIPLKELKNYQLAFDHKHIILMGLRLLLKN